MNNLQVLLPLVSVLVLLSGAYVFNYQGTPQEDNIILQQQTKQLKLDQNANHIYFLLDDSFAMGYPCQDSVGDKTTRFAIAKKILKNYINQLQPHQTFQFVYSDKFFANPVKATQQAKSNVIGYIDLMSPSPFTSYPNLPNLLNQAFNDKQTDKIYLLSQGISDDEVIYPEQGRTFYKFVQGKESQRSQNVQVIVTDFQMGNFETKQNFKQGNRNLMEISNGSKGALLNPI